MKTVLISAAIMLTLAFTTIDPLTGKWESVSSTGTITRVVFKTDSTFEGFINKKPFVTGSYTYSNEDSLFSFVDNGCDGARGLYKIKFYGNADSMRFEVISDSCTQRKEGMQRLRMGRIK